MEAHEGGEERGNESRMGKRVLHPSPSKKKVAFFLRQAWQWGTTKDALILTWRKVAAFPERGIGAWEKGASSKKEKEIPYQKETYSSHTALLPGVNLKRSLG